MCYSPLNVLRRGVVVVVFFCCFFVCITLHYNFYTERLFQNRLNRLLSSQIVRGKVESIGRWGNLTLSPSFSIHFTKTAVMRRRETCRCSPVVCVGSAQETCLGNEVRNSIVATVLGFGSLFTGTALLQYSY